jgi:hypothetical protein
MLLQAPAETGGRTFLRWDVTAPDGWTLRGDGTTVCVNAPSGAASAVARYSAGAAATTLTAQSAAGTYGGTTTLSATLRTASGSTPVVGRTVSFSLGGVSAGTAVTNASGVASVTGVPLGSTGAGSYTGRISATFAGDTSYASTSATADLTVAKAPLAVTADDKTKTYGGPNPALTFSVSGLVNGDSLDAALTTAPSLTTAAATAGAGTYPIAISAGTSANYALSYAAGTLTVAKAVLDLTADDKGRAYGEANPPLTYTVTGLVNGDAKAAALPGEPTLGTTASAASATGTYLITLTGGTPSNNYTLSRHGGTLTVAERAITVTADPQTKIYGETDPALTYRVTSGSLANGDSLSGTLARAEGRDVGTYAIGRGTLSAGSNYAITFEPASLRITARAITVTADAQSKVYGEADPGLTYQVTAGSLAYHDTLVGALERESGRNVGAHAITQGSLSAGGNYVLTYAGADLTITARPITVTADAQSKVYGDADPDLSYTISSGELAYDDDVLSGSLTRATGERVGTYAIRQGTLSAGDNYALTFVSADLTIGQAALTVTADDATKVYGDPNPVLTGTVDGLKNGDALTATYTTEATQGSPAGDYTIVAGIEGAAADNYAVTPVNGTLKVTKAPLTAKVVDSSKVYGEDNPAFSVSYDGFVLGQDKGVLGGTLVYATGATAASGVGAYDVTASGLTSSNYEISFHKGTLTVTKAPLTVTAYDATKLYRAPNPSFTGAATGLKNGDQVTITYSTTATTDSQVGTYPITPAVSGAALANYKLEPVDGTLRVMYGWDGFLQPINDTAHQTGLQQSKFRLGQTIPAKFVIKDAAGTVVQQSAATAPRFSVSGNRGSCGTALEAESTTTVAPTSDLLYSWTGGQYQYNWSTKGLTAGEYRLWANLADGSTKSYVDICLTK